MSEQDYRVEELGLPRESILEEAQRIIYGARNASYGHPRDNFQNIADLWNGYLAKYHTQISPMDVANLVILLKVARLNGTGYHRDSVVDIAGYAGTIERLQESPEGTSASTDARLQEPEPNEDPHLAPLQGPPQAIKSWVGLQEYREGPPRQWKYLRDDIPVDKLRAADGDLWTRADGVWRNSEGFDGHSGVWNGWFTEVRSWASIHAVPAGTSVTDNDGDVFAKDPDGVLWFCGSPWGEIRPLFDVELGPFTEILGE